MERRKENRNGYGRRSGIVLLAVAMLAVLFCTPSRAVAETTEAEFLYLETAGEFTVMFTYEGERPEIVFIAPSGKEYGEGISAEEEFLSAHGSNGGWSTYKVVNAEAGQWNIRYDKKDNEILEYSIVDVVSGICIQSFVLQKIEGNTATVSFEVTKGEEEVWYDYTISVVAEDGETVTQELRSGRANTAVLQEVSVQLNVASCENYKLRLEVVHTDEVETFDSMETEEFSYVNPKTAEAVEDFYVDVDMGSGLCKADWNYFRPWGWNIQYKLEAVADGDTEHPIYSVTTSGTDASFYYPANAKTMTITLYSMINGVLSEPRTKEIDLDGGEYVKVLTDEVTGEATLELECQAKEAAVLHVILNGESGVYQIKEKNTLYFSLQDGWNTIEAYFEGSDRVTYRVSKEIYYSWIAPSITLYEELDGKVFLTGSACISGKAENASMLTVNGISVQPDENGSFSYDVPLETGENEVTIVATTAAGVSTARNLTIIKGTKSAGTVAENATPSVPGERFVPAVLIGILALFLILLFLLCTGKKKVAVAAVLTALSGVVTGAAVYSYVYLHGFNNSLSYVELAKESVDLAAKYLAYENYAKTASLAAAALFLAMGAVLAVCIVRKKRRGSNQ